MKFKTLLLLMIFFIESELMASEKNLRFDSSLTSSFSYYAVDKTVDLNQSFGLSFTVKDLYPIGAAQTSLRSDLFQETWKSEEGSFALLVDRKIFREWVLVTKPVAPFLVLGAGVAMGFSQSIVNAKIAGESSKDSGTYEPLWGLMLDAQLSLANTWQVDPFAEVMLRKVYASNHSKGERTELDFGIGLRF